MKSFCSIPILTVVTLWTGCVEFPTSYSRIEPEKARLLDIIYEPAEAAPGDTVLLKAVFAGRPVTAEELTWRMSSKIIINPYGTATAVDTVPMIIQPQECTFSDRTSCIALRFVVPENVIAESPLIPDDWTELIPGYYRDFVPSELRSMRKSDLLNLIGHLSSGDPSQISLDTVTAAMLPLLLQCCTAQMRIYCSIRDDHTILSRYTVRYNNRFSAIPELHIPVNSNPRIDSVGVYIVHRENLSVFDPADGEYPFDYYTVKDTGRTDIDFDEKKTYFMAVFTGNVDTTMSIDAAMGNGTWLPEQHEIQWYMEFDARETSDVAPSEIMDISGIQPVDGHYLSTLYPSKKSDITNCTVWLEVSDRFLNEFHRPIGSTLRELRLGFTYTDAYLKSVKKR